MDKNTLSILRDAISEIGSWQWWHTEKDMFQMEFSDVLLYDETKEEKEAHTSTIALRFFDNTFAVFLDNYEEIAEKKWYEQFYDDDILILPIDMDEFCFNDTEYAEALLSNFKNKTSIKDFEALDKINTAEYIMAAKCSGTGFIVGGDRLTVIGNKGKYSEEELGLASKRWWQYWRDYWKLRDTPDAYKKDWACEVTIPVDKENPIGKWHE